MMNSWQEWVVALLLLLCAVRIGMSIYSFFHRVKENGNPCDSCASGCELKNLYDKSNHNNNSLMHSRSSKSPDLRSSRFWRRQSEHPYR